MEWNKIKNEMKIKRIKNILSVTDYRNEELNLLLDKITIKEDQTDTMTQSEILSQDVSVLFKKPWKKLPIVHQIIKIKEFCNKIYNNKNKKIIMEKELINKLKNKQINHSQIKYDEINGRIISISNLKKLGQESVNL